MKSFCSICSIDTAITISQINKILNKGMKRKIKKSGIKDLHPTQGKALFLINENESLRLSDLAEELSITKPTVTSLVQKLIREEYISKNICADDKRCSKIELTTKGKEVLDIFLEIGNSINRKLFKGLTEEEICNCLDTLDKMINNYSA